MKQPPDGIPATAYVIDPFSLKGFLLLTGFVRLCLNFYITYRIFLHSKDVTYALLNAARKRLGNDLRRGPRKF